MVNHPNRKPRLTAEQRDLMQRAAKRDVMVLQVADTFGRLERRGLVKMERRDIGLREPTWCVALTDAGRDALNVA